MFASSWRILSVLLFVVVGSFLIATSGDMDASTTMLASRRLAGETPCAEAIVGISADASLPRGDDLPHSPSGEHFVLIDRSVMKWFWWPFLAYLFWGMAYVCDEYFVRTIEVISERFDIPDDVAGATLMALGCNGPEMALNTISIFHPSDIGVGAVIGGEVFNVLVIIGTALLATPDAYLPLRISNFSFFRDVLFYMISVMMLYLVLKDGQVSRTESLALLVGAVVYSSTVAASSMLREACYNVKRNLVARWRFQPDSKAESPVSACRTTRASLCRSTLRRSMSIGEVLNGPRRTKSVRLPSEPNSPSSYCDDLADDSDFENEAEDVLVEAWDEARRCTDPFVGSVVAVRVEVRSRMMDHSNRSEERYMWLTDSALMVSAAVDPEVPVKSRGRTCGMVYDAFAGWHYGGLVNAPDICDGETMSDPRRPAESKNTDSLLRKVSCVPPKAGILGLQEVPCEAIDLRNVLYCDPVPGNPTMFTLHVHQEGGLGRGRLITLEFLSRAPLVHDAWVATLRQHLQNQPHHDLTADQPPPPQTYAALFLEWVAWLQFPVKSLAKMSIPDMDRPELQHLYPVAFVMSMAWLAVFAYLVVAACGGIHNDFGIPTGLLGFTIAAAGTSFPNVFSGMVVSRQGRTTMAIANALGANVQNVFLALAVPWTIQSCFISHGPFPMPVSGLGAQVAAIYITLMPVVVIFVCNGCTMPRWSGYVFLATYLAYLVVALGQQVTGCMSWPVQCS
jgi:K+-dependent Na+/Ca+ exchanger-like protein